MLIHLAIAAPELPLIVNGGVRINSVDAPIGTRITAKMDGKEAASFSVDNAGKYAFTVSRNEAKNKTVSFYVNGILAEETVEWGSGKVVNIDLIVREKGDKLTGFAGGNLSGITMIIILVAVFIFILLSVFILKRKFRK